MKIRNLIKFLSICSVMYIYACAAPYRPIQPHQLVYSEATDTLINNELEITYRYKVLEARENNRYERIAKRNGISLLAMRIANYSADTLYFPEDILIKTQSANYHPLEMDEAIGRLLQFNEMTTDYVATDDPWLFLGMLTADVVNFSVESKANKRLIKEMEEYYLVYSSIPPGAVVSGLVALPIRPHTPLFFEWQK